jgi:hypothetical protein
VYCSLAISLQKPSALGSLAGDVPYLATIDEAWRKQNILFWELHHQFQRHDIAGVNAVGGVATCTFQASGFGIAGTVAISLPFTSTFPASPGTTTTHITPHTNTSRLLRLSVDRNEEKVPIFTTSSIKCIQTFSSFPFSYN